jgi:hypothetical protein
VRVPKFSRNLPIRLWRRCETFRTVDCSSHKFYGVTSLTIKAWVLREPWWNSQDQDNSSIQWPTGKWKPGHSGLEHSASTKCTYCTVSLRLAVSSGTCVRVTNTAIVTVADRTAARSKAWTLFVSTSTETVGSIPILSMEVCVRLFCLYVVVCVGVGLATSWSPYKEPYHCIRKLKVSKAQQDGERELYNLIQKVGYCPWRDPRWSPRWIYTEYLQAGDHSGRALWGIYCLRPINHWHRGI